MVGSLKRDQKRQFNMLPALVEGREPNSRIGLVKVFAESWAELKFDRCLQLCTSDVTYFDNISDIIHPSRPVRQGKEALRKVMHSSAKHWTILSMQQKLIRQRTEDPELVQCRLEFVLIHKASRKFMFCNNRFVARVEDDLISAIQLYHDAPMFLAFLRLNGSMRFADRRRSNSFQSQPIS